MLRTIGYERSNVEDLVQTLVVSGVELVVDIRDRAQSRRPGFSKTPLANALAEAGIGYAHFKELGDPKEGRIAAKQGKFDLFREIFRDVMATPTAKQALVEVAGLAETNAVCLLCYERDEKECHRKIVADHLGNMLGCGISHLGVRNGIAGRGKTGRVLYSDQGATASL